MSIWNRIDDFNHLSWGGGARCFNCGSTKRTTETSVFRPQQMDEIEGYPDLCEGCMTEGAAALGLTDTLALEEALLKAELGRVAMVLEVQSAHDALATLTRENVRLQDLIEDLNSPMEIPTEFEDDDDVA